MSRDVTADNNSTAAVSAVNINDSRYDEPFVPVTERFARQVKLHPGKSAVICRREKLTYTELNEKANRLANSVREMGIGREDIVAVMLERSAMVYVCRQGILKSGAAFLCIAPDYPDDRVSFILEDSGAKLIITDKDILNARKDLFASQKCRAVSAHELIRARSYELAIL